MSDDVSIKFIADVSDLKKGMQEANAAVETTTSALRSGTEQVSSSFTSLSQAYAANAANRIGAMQSAGSVEIGVARESEQAKYEIAANSVKLQSASIREQSQLAQISRQEELSDLLALAAQRESIERSHLVFLQSTYLQGTTAYAEVQRRMEELASQSALRRQDIERSVTQRMYQDYRRAFEQIGASVSSSIMGVIQGQQTLGQAMQRVVLSLIQTFVQARVRIVADWLAGVAAQTSATMAGEAAKTAAVSTGAAVRASAEATASTASNAGALTSALSSITISAAKAFAGIFGFLSPLMGPAAAGPAAAGEATVLGAAAGLASFAVGAWELPQDMIAQVHQGEMIIPSGPAAAMRTALSGGGFGGGNVHVHHATNFNVTAIDSHGVKQFLSNHGDKLMRQINESVRTGAHLGLSKLGSA